MTEFIRCLHKETGKSKLIPEKLVKNISFMKRNGLIVQDLKEAKKELSKTEIDNSENASEVTEKQPAKRGRKPKSELSQTAENDGIITEK